jgi:hypothetical protein
MKDLIELMKQEQKILMAKAKPYIDQYDAIERAIAALQKDAVNTVAKPRAASTKQAKRINAPKGKCGQMIGAEVFAFLQNRGGAG